MLVIFSSKIIKQGHELELTYLYACWIMHVYEAPLANIKMERQRWPEKPLFFYLFIYLFIQLYLYTGKTVKH